VTRIGFRLDPPTLADDAEMENMFFASWEKNNCFNANK
jgi:hypothetical protein